MSNDPRFDTELDLRNTYNAKWDRMEAYCGVSSDDGLAMWVAEMDFPAPQVARDALIAQAERGVYGYFGKDDDYRAAICWWMRTRHDWTIDPAHIFSTHGLVNATALVADTFTDPGDAVVLFTPVYHAFARVLKAAEREITECPLVQVDGRYTFDWDAYDACLTGRERMLILCSPHNPGGRVWTRAELDAVADFARRHDLLILSDEIHFDLTMPGQTHFPMAKIEGIEDRLVMMTATSKSFNLAGLHVGNVIIANPELRKRFGARMAGLGISPNTAGMFATMAVYSEAGAAWLYDLRAYLDTNRQVFDAGVNAIPGIKSMPLEATYLGWVDFSGTGMAADEFIARVERDARIGTNHGVEFGTGGESFLRFNLAAPRTRIQEAVARLTRAFGDLQ